MKLTDVCIKRPVLATVLSLVLLVVGLVSYDKLTLRHYPKIDNPHISITTQFDGASSDIVETQITKVLENVLSSIEGLDGMTSKSEAGESYVDLDFKSDRNIDEATNDVRNAIDRAKPKLPRDAKKSMIRKSSSNAVPIIIMTMYSDRHEVKDVADRAKNSIENMLQSIPGISAVDIWGGGDYNMYVRIDPIKLSAYELSTEDVSNAISGQNIELPAGHLISTDMQIPVTTKAALHTEKEFRNIVLAERDGALIRLEDVAEIKFDAVEDAFKTRYRNKDMDASREAVSLAITKQSIANPLDIARAVKKLLPEMQSILPEGMKIEIANDETVFIDRSLDEVYHTILEATFLVILVIIIFLRSFRASIIPIITIPLSLIGTFGLMYLFGFTINVLTLLALVMAIGMVVDDAIVMLENIYQYIERGLSPLEAAFKGAKEIGFAVVAMTLTLAAVYAPIALSEGMTGKLFSEFALSLAGSVILSGFIALTLTPMMCGKLLKSHAQTEKERQETKEKAKTSDFSYLIHKLDTTIERFLISLDKNYKSLLSKSLKSNLSFTIPYLNKKIDTVASMIGLFGAFALFLLGVILYSNVKENLSPLEDQGFVKMKAFVPKGANMNFLDRYMRKAEEAMILPDMISQTTIIQVQGDPTIENQLVPWESRKLSSMDMVEEIKKKLDRITGMKFYVWGGRRSLMGSGKSGSPIEFVIQTSKSYEDLIRSAKDFHKLFSKIPGINSNAIQDTISDDEQEYIVNINRDKAAMLGIDVKQIADALSILVKGRVPSYTEKEGNRYQVVVELNRDYKRNQEDLESVYLPVRHKKTKEEILVPLVEVVDIERRLAPAQIWHTEGLRSVTYEADIEDGYGIAPILKRIKDLSEKTMPEGTRLTFTGESKRFFEESFNFLFIFLLSIVSIYLVLSAQYESFRDPLIILFSIPMAMIGGIIGLTVMDGSFAMEGWLPTFNFASMSIFGKIGLVTLVGLITKHGILIVDFSNQLLQQGKSRIEAVIEASGLRLRPILMTTLAMILGAIPLALADGAGSESRRQIGWVIVGGMSLGTLFTLFIIPAVYIYVSPENFSKIGKFFGDKLSFGYIFGNAKKLIKRKA